MNRTVFEGGAVRGGVIASAIALLCGGCATPTGKTPQVPPVEHALETAARWDFGQDRSVLDAAERALNACSSRAHRSVAEAALLTLARRADAPRGARQFALQQLGRFGSAEAVEPLLELLRDPTFAPDVSSTLERMRDPGVDERLRAALPRLPPPLQAQVLRVLGTHADPASVPAIEPFLTSDDPALAALAIRALGRIATPAATELVARHAAVAGRAAREGGWDALLSCLQAAVSRGDRVMAERCVMAIDGAGAPEYVRAAAALATAPMATSNERLVRALTMLGSTNGAMQVAGAEILRRHVDAAGVVRAAGAIALMPAAAQIALLGVLEDRGITAAEPAVLSLAAARDPAVRAAALRTLGAMGSGRAVAVLAQNALEGPEAVKVAARRALRRISGAGVDSQFHLLLRTAEQPLRLELVRAAGERGDPSLVRTLLELTTTADHALRREAIKQAGALAGRDEWPRLLDGLLNATDEADADAWLGATEAVALRVPQVATELPNRWESVTAPAARAALLTLAGRLRLAEMLPLVATAAGSDQMTVRNAAIRALGGWADPAALPPLIAAARHPDAASRRLAQRSLVQLLRQCTGVAPADRAARAAEIAPLLEHADEQKALLAILGELGTAAAAEIAAQHLDHTSVRTEAELAVLRAARAPGAVASPAVRAALERIAKESDAPDRRDEAAKLLAPPPP
ncbi:MAG: HEAT repeat domain-containing protein [Kiritimatiellae bacterium]|nr:HEAT repeat domain-containing protein [Kiritimatiellia bacterium]